uniref:Protein tyrosine phosphatase type IVA 3 n=1 Tax=Trichuris muris TaxID=70415 RepID=A0A5S6QWC1_TRIMR
MSSDNRVLTELTTVRLLNRSVVMLSGIFPLSRFGGEICEAQHANELYSNFSHCSFAQVGDCPAPTLRQIDPALGCVSQIPPPPGCLIPTTHLSGFHPVIAAEQSVVRLLYTHCKLNIRTDTRPQMGSFGKNRVPSPNHYYKPAPAEIVFGHMRFLITDRPTDYTISQFIEELKRHRVKDVVRVCEPTYTTEPLRQEGIQILDWEFPDGSPPPKEVRDKWMDLLKDRFSSNPGTCVAVHCVAGLGRAPVLVALALIEAGLKFEDAVDLIRQNRRGAINQKQLYYLEKYKPTGELKKFRNGKREKECVIM